MAKKTNWKLVGNTVKASFASGGAASFDLTAIMPKEATETQKALIYYGFKQWVSSNYASEKNDNDRIESASLDYTDLIEKGLEIRESGNLAVVGRARANAAPKTADSVVEAKYTSMSKAEVEGILATASLGVIKISDEMKGKLEARLKELKKSK